MTKSEPDSMLIRELMQAHPLPPEHNPPAFRPNIEVGKNTAVLKVVGPLVYARDTTAFWLWDNLASGGFWHELTKENGHTTVFLDSRLPSIIRALHMCGKQVLIV